jgi:hypothetical protein
VEEESAMTTMIASEKASDMATVTEMKRGQEQRQREMNVKNNKTAYWMETVKGTGLETDTWRGGVGGEG